MTGESITEMIRKSIQERKDRLMKQKRHDFSMEKIREILDRVDAMPVLDPRSPDEILGYDENGLPT